MRSARITEVFDGDTIRVAYGTGGDRVRILAIDTPQTKDRSRPVECGGKESTDNLLRLSFTDPQDTDNDGLLDQGGGEGRRVTLRTDPTQDTRDRFRRLLAYVTTIGGKNLATQQLSAGWAKVFMFQGRRFQRLARFRAAERRARRANRGAWRLCGGHFDRPA